MASGSGISGGPFAHLMSTIPEHHSSEKARPHWEAARNASNDLAELEGTIKSKAYELSLAATMPQNQRRAAGMNFLAAVIEERNLIDKMNREAMSCIAEDYKANKISQEVFEAQMRDLTQKQNELFNGDVAIHRQRDRVLAEIDDIVTEDGPAESRMTRFQSSALYQIIRCKPPVGRDAEQIQWRKTLYKYYDSQPKRHGPVWCPVTKRFGPYSTRRAAHLVPYKIGYETMGDIFGGDGYSLMWNMGNGLPMDKFFESAFDKFDFCLVPREVEGKPDEWQLILMNESIRHNITSMGDKTWDDYDETFLEFREGCDARPQKRFLHFHYWMCITKAHRELTAGWQDLRAGP